MEKSSSPTKTQFYSANGAGRDSYIYGNNGGFCPMKEPCKIEALGKLYPSLTKSFFQWANSLDSADKEIYCALWNCYWNSYTSLFRHLPILEVTSWTQPCVHSLQACGLCQQWWWTWHLYLGLLRRSPLSVSTCPWFTHLLLKLETVRAAFVA